MTDQFDVSEWLRQREQDELVKRLREYGDSGDREYAIRMIVSAHSAAGHIEAQAKRIAELEAAIKRQAGAARSLRELTLQEVDHLKDKDRSEHIAARTVDGERRANAILTDELDAAQKRITELEAAQAEAERRGAEQMRERAADEVAYRSSACAEWWRKTRAHPNVYEQLDGAASDIRTLPLPPAPQEGE